MERSTIENKFKWTIDEMYPNEESIEKDIQKVKELIEEVKRYKGILADSEENIFKALNISEEASRILQNLYVYTHMKSHEDTRINENQGKATQIDMLSTELSMATSYMVPEIIAMDNEKLENYLKTERLSHYKKYVDEYYRTLAMGIYNLQYAYDPSMIIIGGAISSRSDLLDKVNEQLDIIFSQLTHAHVRPNIKVCQFGNDANLIGATYHYIQRH